MTKWMHVKVMFGCGDIQGIDSMLSFIFITLVVGRLGDEQTSYICDLIHSLHQR